MTRKGKIARLPEELCNEVNRRIYDGEPGVDIVAWLNVLPEVQAVLRAFFGGRPVNPVNLTKWKAGGYCQWLRELENREWVRGFGGTSPSAGTPEENEESMLRVVELSRRLWEVAEHPDSTSTGRVKALAALARVSAQLKREERGRVPR
jgi:hypothetical protein